MQYSMNGNKVGSGKARRHPIRGAPGQAGSVFLYGRRQLKSSVWYVHDIQPWVHEHAKQQGCKQAHWEHDFLISYNMKIK